MKIFLVFSFFVLMLTACEPGQESSSPIATLPQDSIEGDYFKKDLLNIISRSDKIVVIEHSYPSDAWEEKSNKSLLPKNVAYRKIEINDNGKARLLRMVDVLGGAIQWKRSMCMFEPHHTIEFSAKEKVISTMEICFVCDILKWDGSERKPPFSLFRGLAKFIKEIGLEPERDWALLAKKQIK